jgi:dephospho-CoA kinase
VRDHDITMLKVALTGGIATGKTYALRRLRQLGVPTIDADDLVHDAQRAGTPVTSAITEQFGAGVLDPDGGVNRKALAVRVFGDPQARQVLEGILHPPVYQVIRQWLADQAAAGATMGIAAIPLLFETQHEADFDAIVVTACDPEEQVRRVVMRDGATEAEARQRLAAQMPVAEKVKRATFVIWTRGTLQDTYAQVEAAWVALRDLAARQGA